MKKVTLTKEHRKSAIACELVSLCQTITADGVLFNSEIIELTKWLRKHKDSDLPCIGFLNATIESAIADRRLSPKERREIFKSVERILPKEVRSKAKNARAAYETYQRELVLKKREAKKRQTREERECNKPIEHADFMVAGVPYEGRAAIIRARVDDHDRVLLMRDITNRYSRNAIQILLGDGQQIGFVPETEARRLSGLLDKQHPYFAYVKKILTGGRFPIPVIVAIFFRLDATLEDLTYI